MTFKTLFTMIVIMAGVFITTSFQNSAYAQCCSCPGTVQNTETAEWDLSESSPNGGGTVPIVNDFLTGELAAQRSFMVSVWFEDNILPAMMLMAEQLSAVAMQQAMIFGTFLDAKHQMETQRTFQNIQAQAHKDYHPSDGMCEFGSGVKSLAASERKAETNLLALSQISLDRHLGNVNSASAAGPAADRKSRLQQFKVDYCDIRDNNNGLKVLCGSSAGNKERRNKDIDFARTLASATQSELDFSDDTLNEDEEDIIALGQNLYGHKVFTRPPPASLKPILDLPVTSMQVNYLDMRAIIAKRSVAENSFNAIMGMKAAGTSGSKEFLKTLLVDLGIPDTDAEKILGDNPSYDTQMEILTKRIYQNPNFYTNLYDKPANVARKAVAMQAIGLMQKFDTFKSHLRSEASLSVLLELAVMELQREVEGQINPGTGDQQDAQ